MYRGSILHRRGRENSTNFEGGQSRPPLQRAMMNRNVFRFSPRRGRCLHRPAGNVRFMAVFRRIREIAVPRRRGGMVWFYGDPMRIRNVLMGRCGHRPLHEVVFPIPYRRGRCPHRPAGNARFMAVFRRIREIAVPRRRGGRPCPPAGNACFYGNPMQIHNISMGRCRHRPLQTTAENAGF